MGRLQAAFRKRLTKAIRKHGTHDQSTHGPGKTSGAGLRDITRLELQRGDRVIDSKGTFFKVMSVSPAVVRLQDVKTGKRFYTGRQTLLKVPPGDMREGKLSTQRERKQYYYDLTTGPRRRMRDYD